ncbi:MAG: 16S rRNA (guanine(966)-N(2))-methyltransferase RsmD [Lysobacterales bacterium 69-70]|nr:16S rRNA (guanine(966)-N(2))-methyltransferase RsmD [Xanthomonadaceae bacterium]ODU34506.1 MAG: 16S rRNA (guanine(966)-N(2))-methyltransferase RsmD [Xanthomonadaceae bacterium SCN 69-320]ODV19562.1 MAG: 16S rRNA (guanine(966)-N(2))-methyltransferase RsmD [Xanthomonadaceae bacterium SCN 69-25]OJY94772.1 MAG: 16S rRNA (guanine(966)-N(2))-methyltransferase RsmD [Xanthomonadales bacterium 69-70]
MPAAPGKIRIIGGHLRNSRIEVPDRPGLRPTPERVRETLFNWLAAHVGGARVLDLFAGTGALGLEALSRGAREAVFCERDPALAAALRANLARLKQDGRGRVVADDALAALAGLTGPFDVVFLDPPFAADLWSTVAVQLEARGLLGAQSLIYLEAPREAAPALPPGWNLHRQTRAGDVQAALYRRGAALA